MSFEKILFILITSLTGFVLSFIVTYLGIKISKFLLLVGIFALLAFFFIINGSFNFYGINISAIFNTSLDSFGNKIDDVKDLIIRNIPLAVGIILGAIYGFKKAI